MFLWRKKGMSLLLLAGLLVVGACGQSANPNEGAATSSPGTASPNPLAEPVELVVQDLGGGAEETFNALYGDRIRKKFPNVTLKFIQRKEGATLPDLIAAGQHVDLVSATIESIPATLVATDSQLDMTDLIRKHGIDLSKFEQGTIEGIRRMGDGQLWFLPVTNVIQVLYYNKGIFDKLGVSYPKDGMTWEEVAELNQKLTKNSGGVNYMGFSASPTHIFRQNQLSLPLIDPKTQKPTFQNERWQTLIDTYYKQFATNTYKDWTQAKKAVPYYTEMTATQELAMMVFNSTFPFDGPQHVAKIDWDLVSLPVFKDRPKVGTMTSPRVFAVTKMSKHPDMAMEVIKYLTSVEAQMQYSKEGAMTVLNDENVKQAIGSESPYKDKNWKALYYNDLAEMSYKSTYDSNLLTILTRQIPGIVTGQTDVNTALRLVQDEAEKYLAAQKK